MARSKNVIRALVISGFGCAALGVAIVMSTGIGSEKASASTSGTVSAATPVFNPVIPTNPHNGGVIENAWNSTLFADTFRATHIARGYVISNDYPTNNVTLRFQPTEYIKGTPLSQPVVDLVTGLNADLTFTVGQEAVCAWIVRESDGVMGLCHSINSMTPEARGWNPQASVNFYKDILRINEEAGESMDVRLTGKIGADAFQAPLWVREAWVDALVDALGVTGSMAAYHAGMELDKSPVFQGMLKPHHLERIAGFAMRSQAATHDRGYHFILLRKYNSKGVDVNAAVNMIRDEKANVLVDHITNYLGTQFDDTEVVSALAGIYTNKNETARTRANALIATGSLGSRKALPTLRTLLGHETDRTCKRELLTTLRNLADPSNLDPLVNYLNGGDASRAGGVQWDCRNSIQLHKRTMVAIAAIGSEDSDRLIQQAYNRTRVPEMKRFLQPLLAGNKGWRSVVQTLDLEDDLSFDQLHEHYKKLGIFE